MSSSIGEQVSLLRKAAGMSNMAELAKRAGVSRMTIQRIEAGEDVRLQTLLDVLRVLGMDLMLVPTFLQQQLRDFVQAQGKLVGQPSGVAAPKSAVDTLRFSKAIAPDDAGSTAKRVREGKKLKS